MGKESATRPLKVTPSLWKMLQNAKANGEGKTFDEIIRKWKYAYDRRKQ
jgi:hypothetical protein